MLYVEFVKLHTLLPVVTQKFEAGHYWELFDPFARSLRKQITFGNPNTSFPGNDI